ncbi:MAG: glycosyltransferase family 2 protein [Erysipelotrichaceae bacterium]|nr:glycosyltransferase family 2 protein [Erysipelotrichaceae bacterium]
MPLVSILVPVYNVENYIRQCLDSLIHQTYKNFEIVIINDGSQDASMQIVHEFAEVDERIHIYNYENAGISKTRNRALAKANGEYVMYVDSDDVLDHRAIEAMMSYMEENDCDLVTCGYVIEYPYYSIYRRGCRRGTMNTFEALHSLSEGTGITNYPWAKLFKKSCFNNVNFPIRIHTFEDAYTIIRAIANAKKIGNLPNRYYHYIQHQGSLTHHMNLERVYQMRESVEFQDEYLKKVFPQEHFAFDIQYFNADIMILYTLFRYYNRKDRVRFIPSEINWDNIPFIYRIGYSIGCTLTAMKVGSNFQQERQIR